ncbi:MULTISPECIES: lipopolysaccharide biosynthesis protein [Gluconobacter]|uniref:lipopolysaccharide biosynthesis protein n=1 Tax=Gluconobacter TaxID=441 RepID=UPI001B8B1887|nr:MULTISPECIES: lipopolysaccharide biosynthesis protein [Gluconobacter]MBS1051927.1 lipopolysaccharide biosynthesis protein [Gluconobacter japonicus]
MIFKNSDQVFRSILKNAGSLGTAKILGALISLCALICASRTLTPAQFGTLTLIHTFAIGVGALTKFQSWQMILKFGARPLELGDRAAAQYAIQFAIALDITSGFLGALAGVVALIFFGEFCGIEPAYRLDAIFYCTLIPTMTAAAPTGILRLFDRFDLISRQQIITPTLRGLGALASWMTGGAIVSFLITWYMADLIGDLVLWSLSVRELRRKDLLNALRPSLLQAPKKLPGVWKFVWLTNLNTTLDACWSPVGNLIVGNFLGAVQAGRYKIATTLLESAVKPARFLEKGFYPEIMRLDPSSTHPWRLALKAGGLSAAIGAALTGIVWLGGRPLIGLFGHHYRSAADVMMIMAPALIISMGAFPLESLLYMTGRAHRVLLSQIASVLLYLTLLVFLLPRSGLRGAAWAYVIGICSLHLFCAAFAVTAFRKRQKISTSHSHV